jgi:hypothetical protein
MLITESHQDVQTKAGGNMRTENQNALRQHELELTNTI